MNAQQSGPCLSHLHDALDGRVSDIELGTRHAGWLERMQERSR